MYDIKKLRLAIFFVCVTEFFQFSIIICEKSNQQCVVQFYKKNKLTSYLFKIYFKFIVMTLLIVIVSLILTFDLSSSSNAYFILVHSQLHLLFDLENSM